jgi:hypothetical protein
MIKLSILPTLLLAGMSPLLSQQGTAPSVDVDHVILAINRLDRGIEEFTRLSGVVPQRGGQHPGRGTENALVSLGDGTYLEILAPITPDSSSEASRLTRLTPAGWALHSSDLGATVAQLRKASVEVVGPMAGSRRRPDGSLLQWQTATVTGAGLELAPFFIAWSASSPHPSTTSPTGCRLVSLELLEPEPSRLEAFFAAVGYHATIRKQDPSGMRLTLDCAKGRVSFVA